MARIRKVSLVILGFMTLCLLALFAGHSTLADTLNPLLAKRDVEGLTAYASQGAWTGRNPLTAIKTNGPAATSLCVAE